MTSQRCRLLPLVAVSTALLAPGAVLAVEIEPGQWEASETSDVNGKPGQPELSTECVTPEDARDPVKALTSMQNDSRAKCKVGDVTQTGNVVTSP
jgi:hypothetical protein